MTEKNSKESSPCSGCDSPFSYSQVADVQESLREIENTLNIKAKE